MYDSLKDKRVDDDLLRQGETMQMRKVQSATIKMFGDAWKHPALKPYNGKEVLVDAKLNGNHQTELTVMDGGSVICTIERN